MTIEQDFETVREYIDVIVNADPEEAGDALAALSRIEAKLTP